MDMRISDHQVSACTSIPHKNITAIFEPQRLKFKKVNLPKRLKKIKIIIFHENCHLKCVDIYRRQLSMKNKQNLHT